MGYRMQHISRLIVSLAGLAVLAGTSAALDVELLFERYAPAVVVILGERPASHDTTQSSGCCVDTSGLILATAHQIQGVTHLRAVLKDGSERTLEPIEVDGAQEFALLRAQGPLPVAASLGDAGALREGAELVAIAAPKSLSFTANAGIVSSLNRMYKGQPVIQTQLPAGPGSSGGPVFDARGRLVGLILARIDDQEWLTLVNPINEAYPLLRKHGVAIPTASRVGNTEGQEVEILPASDLTPAQQAAIDAYNRGVVAETPEEKIEAYSLAVSLIPEFYEAWFNVAVAYGAAGRPERAIAAYRQAQALRPEALGVYRNLGRELLATGQDAQAEAAFRRAVELAPGRASLRNDLGESLRRQKDFDEAESAFRAALALDKSYSPACYNLALTYTEMGKSTEAIEAFRRYLTLSPAANDAARVAAWIESLDSQTKG